MWTSSWRGRLVHNLVSNKLICYLDNLQKFEDNLDCLGFRGPNLTLFLTSLNGFSPTSLFKLLNPNNLKLNLDYLKHTLHYLKHSLDYIYDYVYMIYAFVKFLDEPPVIICLSCHHLFSIERSSIPLGPWQMVQELLFCYIC